MFSFYKKSYQRSSSIFSRGASNEGKYVNLEKTSEINFYRALRRALLNLTVAHPSPSILPIILSSIFSKLYHLGNCSEQAFTLFMETLTNGTLNKNMEIIHVHGKYKIYFPPEVENILGTELTIDETHALVIYDRDMSSDINNPASWKYAYASDTWGKKLLEPREVTKNNLKNAGRFFGEVKINSAHRRDSYLSKKECDEIIDHLIIIKKTLSKELIYSLLQKPKTFFKKIENVESETNKIQNQIDLEIEIFKKLTTNTSIKIDDLLVKHWEKNPNYSEDDFIQKNLKR